MPAVVASTIEVRPVRDDDVDAVRRLDRTAMRDAGTDPADLPDREELASPAEAYDGPGSAFLVGEVGGTVVAMGALRPASGDGGEPRDATGELKWMRVAPDRQGEGHGTAVLAALENAARDAGYERLVAETAVRQDALTFYGRHGYVESGRRTVGEYELVTLERSV